MKKVVLTGLILTVITLFILSPHASSLPDGLERVAIRYGFVEKEKKIVDAPFPDYQVKVTKNEKVSTVLAGLIGSVVVFTAVVLFFKLMGKRDETPFFR